MTIDEYNVLNDEVKQKIDKICNIYRFSIDKIKDFKKHDCGIYSFTIDNSENELAYYKKKVEEGDEFYRQFIN